MFQILIPYLFRVCLATFQSKVANRAFSCVCVEIVTPTRKKWIGNEIYFGGHGFSYHMRRLAPASTKKKVPPLATPNVKLDE